MVAAEPLPQARSDARQVSGVDESGDGGEWQTALTDLKIILKKSTVSFAQAPGPLRKLAGGLRCYVGVPPLGVGDRDAPVAPVSGLSQLWGFVRACARQLNLAGVFVPVPGFTHLMVWESRSSREVRPRGGDTRGDPEGSEDEAAETKTTCSASSNQSLKNSAPPTTFAFISASKIDVSFVQVPGPLRKLAGGLRCYVGVQTPGRDASLMLGQSRVVVGRAQRLGMGRAAAAAKWGPGRQQHCGSHW